MASLTKYEVTMCTRSLWMKETGDCWRERISAATRLRMSEKLVSVSRCSGQDEAAAKQVL